MESLYGIFTVFLGQCEYCNMFNLLGFCTAFGVKEAEGQIY